MAAQGSMAGPIVFLLGINAILLTLKLSNEALGFRLGASLAGQMEERLGTLSLGARRRDFFLAVQGILLLYTMVCWLLQIAVSAIPVLFHWSRPERWSILTALRGPNLFSYPLLCLAVLLAGCVCGLIFTRSKAAGVIIVFAAAVLGVFGVTFLFVTSDTWGEAHLGVLPVVLTAGAVAVIGVSEGFLWRTISRYAVK